MERAERKQNFRTQQIQMRIKQKEDRIRAQEEQRKAELEKQKRRMQKELFTRQKILGAKVTAPSAEQVEKKLVSLLGSPAAGKVRDLCVCVRAVCLCGSCVFVWELCVCVGAVCLCACVPVEAKLCACMCTPTTPPTVARPLLYVCTPIAHRTVLYSPSIPVCCRVNAVDRPVGEARTASKVCVGGECEAVRVASIVHVLRAVDAAAALRRQARGCQCAGAGRLQPGDVCLELFAAHPFGTHHLQETKQDTHASLPIVGEGTGCSCRSRVCCSLGGANDPPPVTEGIPLHARPESLSFPFLFPPRCWIARCSCGRLTASL